MKRPLAWFAVIALAVAAGSLLASWIAEQFATAKSDAWQSRPRIGFQPDPPTVTASEAPGKAALTTVSSALHPA